MTTAETTFEQLDLFEHLQIGAHAACSRLASVCQSNTAHSKELNAKFYDAVADVQRVTIETLATSKGAFSVEEGNLRISEGPIAKLLSVVVSDFEERLINGTPSLDAKELPNLLERVFVQYVLHEVRHRTQGLSSFDDVQALKQISGRPAMAEYDIYADRDAALAVAALYADDESRGAFLQAFREALFFSTRFFFEVFPIPIDRPDKIARAMAVLFMAARLAHRDFSHPTFEDDTLPLDAPLYVSLSAASKTLAVHRGEPSRQLLGFANDVDGVGDLMAQICNGDMEAAYKTSFSIADKLRLT